MARRALLPASAAVAIAVAMRLYLGHTHPEYDSLYALLWGDDLAHGRSPDLDLRYAPAAHPLYLLLGALLSPLGAAASAEALVWIVLLATGALCVAIFRLGGTLFAWPVGLAAAALFATRMPTLHFASGAFGDLPAAALVVWAAVLEARRPRRGAAVLVLLAVAGLLRPEAWLLAAAYWLWLAPPLSWPERLRAGVLAAAGPLAWLAIETVVSGRPLRPVTDKNASIEEVGSRTGLGGAPRELAHDLGGFLQAPVLVLAGLGLVAGALWLRRRAALPAAVAALGGLAFLILGAAQQPLEQRYLMVAAAMACVFAGVAVLGWTALPEASPVRRRWRVAGLVALLALVGLGTPRDVDRANDLRTRTRQADEALGRLRDLVDSGAGREALHAARNPQMPTARPLPFVALYAKLEPGRLDPGFDPAQADLVIAATEPLTRQLLVRSLPDPDAPPGPDVAVPEGWRLVGEQPGWAVYSAG